MYHSHILFIIDVGAEYKDQRDPNDGAQRRMPPNQNNQNQNQPRYKDYEGKEAGGEHKKKE